VKDNQTDPAPEHQGFFLRGWSAGKSTAYRRRRKDKEILDADFFDFAVKNF
jgi:hypothetical protein